MSERSSGHRQGAAAYTPWLGAEVATTHIDDEVTLALRGPVIGKLHDV